MKRMGTSQQQSSVRLGALLIISQVKQAAYSCMELQQESYSSNKTKPDKIDLIHLNLGIFPAPLSYGLWS